jgi:hypothetical protein
MEREDDDEPESLRYLKFFKTERDEEGILSHLLRNYDEDEFDVRNKVARVKNILVDQLDNFGETEKAHFRRYLLCDHLKQYLEFFCGKRE